MNLITGRRVGDGVELAYHQPDGEEEFFSYTLSRVVIGCSFPREFDERTSVGMGAAVVVGERIWHGREGNLERVFIILDEYEGIEDVGLFEEVLRFKDSYLAETVVCPKDPRPMVEALRRHEGIAYYRSRPDHEAREMWDTYVSRETIAGIRDLTVQDRNVQRRHIEALRNTVARDPNNGEPILDASMQQIPRLIVPEGFNNHRAASGLAAGIPEIIQAVWLATYHLEYSVARYLRERQEEFHVHSGNTTTGY